jgi:phage recombination protein Bet
MASKMNVEPSKLLETLKATAFKGASNEEMLALVVVSNEYGLSPLTKQIYAFPAKGGGIVPVVSIDGWISMVNRQPQLDGIEFDMSPDGEECTCHIHIKGRSKPVVVTEYKSECFRATEPWKTMPKRMLRHKALIQCARVAFGFSGIYDEDEATRISAANAIVVESEPSKPTFKPKIIEPARESEPVQEAESFTLEEGKPTSIEILRRNLADSSISEKSFITYVAKAFNSKARTIGELTEDQADEILGAFAEIAEELSK